ncbi:Stk1 family PASTA domain-containing Ser/Thr kinase [Aneurinibacillus aneurinilyticus]|uniref:Stk1 family PASTA domain-containing Ser/Thr kinase n=1 Tax=Aneurinibacillus aneurinilyticus TaxID=1391 RepID=UPI0023F1F4E2|nr:Stk1 family PASTA domain-containing Ser/Thr kinase [Aneurinibacillus aneurinilyticus]
MKKGLYERYVPDTLLYTGEAGELYRGHDSILRRDILLCIFPRKAAQTERIMHGSSTLQILDRGETVDKGFAVLEYIPGLLLDSAPNARKLSLKEALGMAREFIQILQEADQTIGRGLMLTKYNLWLTEAGEIKVVNTWEVSEAAVGHEISDMFRLMHHLMFGAIEIELPISQVIEEMALSYTGDPFVIRKSLRAIWRREEKRSTEQYERMLAQTLEDITSLYQYIKKMQAGVRSSVSFEEREETQLEKTEQPRRNGSMKNPGTKKKWFTKFPMKRFTAVALLAIVCITAFAFMQNDNPSSAKSVEAVKPDTAAEPPKTENKAGVEVPDVKGLSLEEAGQKLDQAGLHYKYYLESSIRKKGTVLKQNPAAGEHVSRLEPIELWVSN